MSEEDEENEEENEEETQEDSTEPDVIARNQQLLEQHRENQRQEIAQQLLDDLPQGEGSTLDADTVDGLHARDLLGEIAKKGSFHVGGSGLNPHVVTHAKGGSDAFAGDTHELCFQFEHVASLPVVVTEGRAVFLLTDGHVYVGH